MSTAACSQSTRRARAARSLKCARPASLATQQAAAPSVRGEELPAESEPFAPKAGRSAASRSSEVSLRGIASSLIGKVPGETSSFR